MAADSAARVCVAAIAGAHGVRGLVRLKSFTEQEEDVFAYGPLTDETGTRRFTVTPAGRSKDRLLARIEGVADRDAAEALRGTRLYLERARLPEPAADEYYHADLIGLSVEDVSGTRLGTVKAVHEFGAGPVLDIAPSAGPSFMVPFTKEAVPVVDLAGGRIAIDPPRGLIGKEANNDRA